MEESWVDGLDDTKVTFALIAGLLGLLYWYSISAFSQLQKMGIRHPKPTPFIGNVLLFRKGFWEGSSQILKKYGPISGYYLGRRPMVLLSDPEAVKQVLQKDFLNFTNRMKMNLATKPMSDSLLCLRDEHWKRVRSVLTPSFSAARMKEMCPLINQGCDVLLSNLQKFAVSGEPCNVQRCYACFTMDIVASVAFGTKVDSQKDPDHPLVQNSKKFLELFTPFKPVILLTLAFPSIMIPIARRLPNKKRDQINSFFGKVIKEMIALRDQQPPDKRRRDLLQLMLDARTCAANISVENFDIVNQADMAAHVRDEPSKKTTKTLNEEEILGQAFIFLIAGYETTSSLLSFTTYLLATHPECQEKLLREVDKFAENHDGADYNTVHDLPYMDMVISESLRMYPPAFRFAREAAADCTVMGCKIPSGTVLEIPIGCMQNDPKYWPEPEAFRPERFTAEEKQKRHPFLYLPFGAGPRSCIGMRLAILEAKITLYRILQKFRFEICSSTQIPLQVTALSTLRPKDGVFVRVVAR
ncbi:thromboxane-A synthase [Bufo gargarizans]|uniref:thromboxane-A synthase n=1 Tax=Bufo gargarizans TaxID=30331 RepID=UPI001CF53243|nr:thromboxane-A synthase [Bufo gargarizans]XP_044137261.1 thromboxane-A synthase [Bufo gargarizans]XP_044137263.1 thromboxane-A synthase [Bufo gargarizans]XP_044137264.1 thromboxane-A synthase [Bufo gargarizans]XP_044137265.1 thromboxane-A synthase [Bufo gargarizans]XP_044137266.1 thromboxane-A synthase [Bufo gargarizans]